jgi:antitoxin VapB
MKTAKLFKYGRSQAVLLPKRYRFEGMEVVVEKRGEAIILRPKPKPGTLADLFHELRAKFPDGSDFPPREQPKAQQKRHLGFY